MSHSGHFRAHGRHVVEVSATLAHGNEPNPVRVVNLSLAGACIDLEAPLDVGASVTIEIVAPSLWDPLVLRGRVVWTRGAAPLRAGVAFEHAHPARAFALFDLLSSSAPLARDRDQALGSG